MTKTQKTTKLTDSPTTGSLLEKAKNIESNRAPKPNFAQKEELELAFAYHRREVFASQVASVLGIKSSQVGNWFVYNIMKAFRHGHLRISMADDPSNYLEGTKW